MRWPRLQRSSAGGSTSRIGADASLADFVDGCVLCNVASRIIRTWSWISNRSRRPSTNASTTKCAHSSRRLANITGSSIATSAADSARSCTRPAIPTPSQGYAFEGKQGNFGLAAFDAIGVNRTDAATALDYTSPDTRWQGSYEHVTADIPGVIDDANEIGMNYSSLKYLSALRRTTRPTRERTCFHRATRTCARSRRRLDQSGLCILRLDARGWRSIQSH